MQMINQMNGFVTCSCGVVSVLHWRILSNPPVRFQPESKGENIFCPFISHKKAMDGRGPVTPGIGDLQLTHA